MNWNLIKCYAVKILSMIGILVSFLPLTSFLIISDNLWLALISGIVMFLFTFPIFWRLLLSTNHPIHKYNPFTINKRYTESGKSFNDAGFSSIIVPEPNEEEIEEDKKIRRKKMRIKKFKRILEC